MGGGSGAAPANMQDMFAQLMEQYGNGAELPSAPSSLGGSSVPSPTVAAPAGLNEPTQPKFGGRRGSYGNRTIRTPQVAVDRSPRGSGYGSYDPNAAPAPAPVEAAPAANPQAKHNRLQRQRELDNKIYHSKGSQRGRYEQQRQKKMDAGNWSW